VVVVLVGIEVAVGHHTVVDIPILGRSDSEEKTSLQLDGRCSLLVEDTVVEVVHTAVAHTVVHRTEVRRIGVGPHNLVGSRSWSCWVFRIPSVTGLSQPAMVRKERTEMKVLYKR